MGAIVTAGRETFPVAAVLCALLVLAASATSGGADAGAESEAIQHLMDILGYGGVLPSNPGQDSLAAPTQDAGFGSGGTFSGPLFGGCPAAGFVAVISVGTVFRQAIVDEDADVLLPLEPVVCAGRTVSTWLGDLSGTVASSSFYRSFACVGANGGSGDWLGHEQACHEGDFTSGAVTGRVGKLEYGYSQWGISFYVEVLLGGIGSAESGGGATVVTLGEPTLCAVLISCGWEGP